MKKSHTFLPILMAGLLAGAGVYAQSAPAAGSSDGPPKAGEASNQTQGVPNAKTTNSPVTEAPLAPAMNKDTRGMGAAAATTLVPGRAGEASTTVQGKPNANPNTPMMLSRADVVNDLMTRRARFEALRNSQRS